MNPHIVLTDSEQHGEPRIRKALALQSEHVVAINIIQRDFFQAVLGDNQILDLHKKPGVYTGQMVNLIHTHAGAESITDVPDALRLGISQLSYQLVA